MNRIEQTYIINASPEEVWAALTEADIIMQWSGAPASFTAEPNAEYRLWDGDITGRVVEIEPLVRLVQTWKPDNWTEENSVVTFTLTPDEAGTRVDLVHENVQDSDYDDTNQGWDTFYLGALKKLLESPRAKETRKPANKTAPRKKAATKKATKTRAAAKKSAAKKKTAKGAGNKRSAKR